MNEIPLRELFACYLNNSCTADEIRSLLSHFNTDNEVLLRQLIAEEFKKDRAKVPDSGLYDQTNEVWQKIKQKLDAEEPQLQTPVVYLSAKRPVHFWMRMTAAACVLFLLGASVYYLQTDKKIPIPKPVASRPVMDTLAPGTDKAMLTLSNGRKINLDNAPSGVLATEAAAKIKKAADGKVLYESLESNASAAIAYNTLSTPRGGKFDLTLSDGTRVWLNAASSIRYPSVFTGNSREVEITGEAYFEVKHNAAKPFRVKASGQLIEDIGTAFNVNAYDDEPVARTTLVEGSVRVSAKNKSAVLKPGEQAVISNAAPWQVMHDADVEQATAWHKGLFNFQDADIQTVMRQIARWYDVDISYEGAIPQRRFSGKIYRNVSALKVADILSYKQIHFRIQGRKIIVLP